MKKILYMILAVGMLGCFCSDVFATTKKDHIIRTREREEKCRENLAILYSALTNYAAENNGALPAKNNNAGLAMLMRYGMLLENLDCPQSKGRKIKKASDITAERISYIYFSGINLRSAIKSCPNIPLIIDRPDSRHHLALLADGSIIKIDPRKYKRKISNCIDLVEILHAMYDYPPDILKALRVKAKNIDRQLELD